jgi:hypothetical protein
MKLKIGNDNILYIDNQTIEKIGDLQQTKSFKFLGMEIDETISWKKHIDKVCTKISRANYIINKVKNTIPKQCLLTLYQSIIQCHINYGLQIWGSSSRIEKIYKIQKKSIRIINKMPYNFHTEPLFKECGILTIKDQYKFNVAIFMNKLRNNELPQSFNDLKYFTKPDRPTRQIHVNMATQQRARTKFSSLLPFHKFPHIWNNLHPEIREIQNTTSFKRKLRSKLLESYEGKIICVNRRCRQCFPI